MEPILYIKGEKPLEGHVHVQGSKNAALPIIAAALLIRGVTILHNCPDISDVRGMLAVLNLFGCKSWRLGHTVTIDATYASWQNLTDDLVKTMRASCLFLGSTLTRFHRASICLPGGCEIGKRPIDGHIIALKKLGASVRQKEGLLLADAQRLYGAEITPLFHSVGVTEQIIISAVCAEGITKIHAGAREPEIDALCDFLKKAGANIEGHDGELTIVGVKQLKETVFTIPGDRIVAGSYLCMALAARGRIKVSGINAEELSYVCELLKTAGGDIQVESDSITLQSDGNPFAIPYIETAVYPGFPTDLQSIMCAALLKASGQSIIRETVFENRMQAALEMKKFGAQIDVDSQKGDIIIYGRTDLRGTCVKAKELRGGVALVLAGLCAKGVTKIEGCDYILRGHESIVEDLRGLGADIRWDYC